MNEIERMILVLRLLRTRQFREIKFLDKLKFIDYFLILLKKAKGLVSEKFTFLVFVNLKQE